MAAITFSSVTPENPSERRFTPEEINQILRKALEKQGPTSGVNYQDLVDTARELGIDVRNLDAAIHEQSQHDAVDEARQTWLNNRKKKFWGQFRSYVFVNALLAFGCLFLFGDFMPLKMTMFFWGIGLTVSYFKAFFPGEKDIERGTLKLMMRNQRQELQQRIKKNGRVSFDGHNRKLVIEKGDKRIEIG